MNGFMRSPRFTATVIGAAGVLLAVAAAPGQVPTDPTDTSGIGIVEKLNGQVPLELRFTDDTGRSGTPGDYFRGEEPVRLTLCRYTRPGAGPPRRSRLRRSRTVGKMPAVWGGLLASGKLGAAGSRRTE